MLRASTKVYYKKESRYNIPTIKTVCSREKLMTKCSLFKITIYL